MFFFSNTWFFKPDLEQKAKAMKTNPSNTGNSPKKKQQQKQTKKNTESSGLCILNSDCVSLFCFFPFRSFFHTMFCMF